MPKKKKYFNWLRKKPKKPENGKASGTMNMDNRVSYLHQQQPDSRSVFTLHRTINTLPYDNFILIITGDELAPLIISGNPPIEELVTVWDIISHEYAAALKNQKTKSTFDCYKKIVRLEAQIKLIEVSLVLLTQQYDADLANMLFEMGYSLITPEEDQEEYLRQVELVRTEAKTLVVVLNQTYSEYKIMAPAEQITVKREYQSYIDELAVLAKYQGVVSINPKNITVAEYCAIANSFMAYHEAIKRNHK